MSQQLSKDLNIAKIILEYNGIVLRTSEDIGQLFLYSPHLEHILIKIQNYSTQLSYLTAPQL